MTGCFHRSENTGRSLGLKFKPAVVFQEQPSGLPFGGIVFGLGQFGDVVRGVVEGCQPLAFCQRDWFVEIRLPAHWALILRLQRKRTGIQARTPSFGTRSRNPRLAVNT